MNPYRASDEIIQAELAERPPRRQFTIWDLLEGLWQLLIVVLVALLLSAVLVGVMFTFGRAGGPG
jgi:hypothetical protein